MIETKWGAGVSLHKRSIFGDFTGDEAPNFEFYPTAPARSHSGYQVFRAPVRNKSIDNMGMFSIIVGFVDIPIPNIYMLLPLFGLLY